MKLTSLRALVLVPVVAAGLAVLPAAPTFADYGCPGDRDSWREYRNDAGTLAAVAQRYDTADGVCINLVAKNQYFGRPKFMSLTICGADGCKTNEGRFEQYAGPLYSTSNCVSVHSIMKDGNGGTIMNHRTYLGACN